MSKSFKIVNGDFDFDSSGNPTEIEGTEKLKQDIMCLLLTPLDPYPGFDIYHPEAGCNLNIVVGEPMPKTKMDIKYTVMNMLQYYQQLQQDQLAKGTLPASEVLTLTGIGSNNSETFLDNIDSVAVVEDADAITIKLHLRTRDMKEITINKKLFYLINQE